MSEGNPLVEPVLRRVRYAQTVGAVKRFESAPTGQAITDGQEFYRMRSAMDVSPSAGKSTLAPVGAQPPGWRAD